MQDESKQEAEWYHQDLIFSVRKIILEDKKWKTKMREAKKNGPEAVGEIIKRMKIFL